MLRVLTYNILFGGTDGHMGDRTEPILHLLRETKPDVAVLIEANGFEDSTRRMLFESETDCNAFVSQASTGFHICTLVNKRLKVSRHMQEPGRFFHTATSLAIELKVVNGKKKDEPRFLTIVGAHLDPFSPEERLKEARILARHANPSERVLLCGDFNCLPPDDDVDPSVPELPKRILARFLKDPLNDTEFDTGAHDLLRWAGFEDVYRKLNPKKPGWTLLTTRFAAELRSRMRIDFIYATKKIATKAVRAEVLESDDTRRASDHYPILAEFDIPIASAND